MKKLLITGTSSYIGNSLEKWLEKSGENYDVDKISLRGDGWKDLNFSKYDSVFHVAGIVHKKETEENRDSYYKINRDLAFEVAEKSKSDGVKQFVFLSTMSVYGLETGAIDRNTPLKPNTNYGKSKFQAEERLKTLSEESFKVAVMRPPMVYGRGCKGNYPKLSSLARKTPVFPQIENKRSMIYIDHLSEFTKHLIDDRKEGLFFPQNREYVCTSEMVELIGRHIGKNIFMTRLFNPIIKILNLGTVEKVFGDLTYEKEMSVYEKDYQIFKFEDTIKLTETP